MNLDLCAQSCPQGAVNNDQLIHQVENAQDADTIYRVAAIGGQAVIPALRKVSQGGMSFDSVPGAAQVSLARLGDKDAFESLKRELNETKYPSLAVHKFVRVGDDQAVSVLMTYLSVHLHDDSLYKDFGDYSYDLRSDITELLGKQLGIGPVAPKGGGAFALSAAEWLVWWERSKGTRVTLSISGEVEDPYLKCLARKVEWGFPNAIYDLANTGGPHVIDVLTRLENVGAPSLTLDIIHDRATLGLAKLGDEHALQTIAHKLHDGQSQWIGVLQWIGGKKAVAILIEVFDDPTYLGDFRTRLTPKDLAEYERAKDSSIAATLAVMIDHPPHFEGPVEAQKKQWKEWWAKNKGTAQFVTPPVTTYE